MSTVRVQIATRSKLYKEGLTNLHNFIDAELLEECFKGLNKKAAAGIDEQDWESYQQVMPERMVALLSEFRSGSYKAPPVRRVYITKEDGSKRPLGIPTMEDKLLQTAVVQVMEPIYEGIFYPFSYGFRPGKSQHQALDKLSTEVSYYKQWYIIDADMQNYFGSIVHAHLREFIDQKVKDGVIKRTIDKWLKAGVLEDEQLSYDSSGTPQGGSISPLLSNIYLHYVLDEWYHEMIKPLLKGRNFMIRFADDFVMGFTDKAEAERVMKALPQRLAKYGLTLHPDKTKLIELNKRGTFDFLGFTHYQGKSQKGKLILKRKTSKKKQAKSLKSISQWLRTKMHSPLKELIRELNQKLVGTYNYYGITHNSRSIRTHFYQVQRQLFKVLNRRSNKRSYIWETFNDLIEHKLPLTKPRIYHKSF